MCGICGVFAPSGGAALERDGVIRMMGTLGHRGPDGAGIFVDDLAVLGHTRLSILDLAGGAQPLWNEDGSIVVTFNGEIFNYVELRAELLSRGHVFRTQGDTEVLVHLYEESGTAMFGRLNGQFALALLDRRLGRLVLARDAAGILPLFHARGPGGRIWFASEIKGLLAAGLERRIAPEGVAQAMSLWAPLAPRTCFAGIEQLPPGHLLIADARGVRVTAWAGAAPPAGPPPSRARVVDLAVELRERLTASVAHRLRSDVPVGAYVSGGLDSTILATLLAAGHAGRVSTFSLRFDDRAYDEGSFQGMVASRLGTDHAEVFVGSSDIGDVFPDVVWHAESTLLRTAAAPMLLLSRLVRRSGFKVVLTGEGADEAFGGYDLFREAKVRAFWARGRGSEWRARLVERLYPWLANGLSRAPGFARSFFARGLDRPEDPAFSHRPRWDAGARLMLLLAPDVRASLASFEPEAEALAALPEGFARLDPLRKAQELEFLTLMPGYLLSHQGDRVLMASSVEGRYPFLDPGILTFARTLHRSLKLAGLREKVLLKRAFAADVPPGILTRPKQPYRAPDVSPFIGPAAPEWVAEVLSDRALADAGLFDGRPVGALLKKLRHDGGRSASHADSAALVAVISTQLLHRQFVAGFGARTQAPIDVVQMTPALATP